MLGIRLWAIGANSDIEVIRILERRRGRIGVFALYAVEYLSSVHCSFKGSIDGDAHGIAHDLNDDYLYLSPTMIALAFPLRVSAAWNRSQGCERGLGAIAPSPVYICTAA